MAEDYKIIIGAKPNEAEFDAIEARIRDITKTQTITFQIDPNLTRQLSNIENTLRRLQNAGRNNGGSGGSGNNNGGNNGGNRNRNPNRSGNQAIQRAYKDLINLRRRMESTNKQLLSLDTTRDSRQIEILTRQLDDLRNRYNSLMSVFGQSLSIDQVANLSRVIDTASDKLVATEGKIEDSARNIRDTLVENINNGIRTDRFELEISNAETAMNSLSTVGTTLSTSMSELRSNLTAMKTAINDHNYDAAIEASERYEASLERVNNQIKIQQNLDRVNKSNKKMNDDSLRLDVNKRAFESQMDVWLNKNSEAAEYFADKISEIKQRLKECDATELSRLRTEFTDLKRQAELAGKTVKSFGDRLSDQFKRFGTYFALDNIIDEAVQGIRDMYQQVVDIDTAMTDLYKVTDETPERYQQFLSSAQSGAKELGRSVSSYITQSAKWAQMGYGIGDSEQLAKISSIYANVADIDDATAVGDIVATLKAFDLATSDAITIVDSLNKLGKLMPMRNYIG